MRIVLFGPPGAGKGTQARLLHQRRGLVPISTGALIREEIAAGTPDGRASEEYIRDGRLVPGPLVRRIAEHAIAEHGYDNFILDGYPRTVEQAEWLDAFLQQHQASLNAVISLEVPTDVIVERLSRRRVHKLTGENYHLDFKPPPPDVDPSLIVQRPDDRPEVIRQRLEVYYRRTLPVEAYYADRDYFFRISGLGDVEDVYARIDRVLKQVEPAGKTA